MKPKAGFIKIAMVCVLFCSTMPLYAVTPWLHADANLIKDPCNNVVVLRGVDLIDLGFLESWQGGAINMINRLTNLNDSQGSSPGWYPRVLRICIVPADAAPTWPNRFNPGNNDFYNNLLRPVVDYCRTKDLYVIIDWHYVAHTYDHVATTSQFWEYMAPRFADDSHVMFELFNEPNDEGSSETNRWLTVRANMQTWINIVRTYAPNNIILVAGPSYSQEIGKAATYPLTGDNIVMVSHIYPGHWLSGNKSWYTNHITTCLTRYPVFMTEWGFCNTASYSLLRGTITNYGQPLMDFREIRKISNSAWVASYDWEPPMFFNNWTLRVGEGEMGGFTKDKLYEKRNSDQQSDGDTTPAAAPTGLTATVGAGTILLNWGDNVESDLYGYDIYRSTTSGSYGSRLNLVRTRDSNYTDANVAPGTTYYYVVTAVDRSFNYSDYSSEVSATTPADTTAPLAPTGLDETAGNGTVPLNWNDNSEGDLAGYNVYRSTTSGGSYIRLNGSLLSSSDYADSNVTNGTTYYYVVTAVDTSFNESANSSEVSATPGPRMVVIIIGSWLSGTTHTRENGSDRALVFIAHVEDNDGAINPSSVTYGGQAMTKVIDINVGTTNRAHALAFILNEAGVAAATNSTFTINWGSNPPDTAAYSSVFYGNVDQTDLVGATARNGVNSSTPNPITTNPLATSNGDVVIVAATCGYSGSYQLNNGFLEGNDQTMGGTATGVTGYKPASGLPETPSATYNTGPNYQVIIGFVVNAAAIDMPPAAPTGLTATPGVGTILLDWNDNGEGDLAGYNVWRMPEGGYYEQLNGSLVTVSNYTDTAVSNGATYYYLVSAVDTALNESDASNEVSATPSVAASGTGAILCEWWLGIPGTSVSDLTSDVNYPDNPSGEEMLIALEGPVNWADNYGTRIRGYLNPVTTGSYTFWIASDDDSDLWLSTDSDPVNAERIAYMPGNPQSSLISLTAGQKYYIEVLHKEGTGNDNISVSWQGPGISQQVIDGIYLSPCGLEFTNFADFAAQWNRSDCNAGNDWCGGADFDRDGSVTIEDLKAFADAWLAGI